MSKELYHIFGPSNQSALAHNIDDALKQASRMVYLPVLRVGAYRKRLQEGDIIHWTYGFDMVRIEPVRDQVRHMGLWFTVVARFPDTPEGTSAANHYMTHNPGTALLCIQEGIAYLAHEDDKGTRG